MPHLTLETTSNLSPLPGVSGLLLGLHRLLEKEAGIALENCKSRHREARVSLVGSGGPGKAFAHLDIRLLEGRTQEVLGRVGRVALQALTAFLAEAGEGLDLQITVEVQELRRATYFKHPPGTLSEPPKKMA
jgi:5-carboxymethyl-2-hydroxymuconate isomerase